MYRELSRLLFPLVVAMSGIALMTFLGEAPKACALNGSSQCARVAPVSLPVPAPGDRIGGARIARPLRVSLPDFLNLGAARRSVEVIK